jgi:hypothetical protein
MISDFLPDNYRKHASFYRSSFKMHEISEQTLPLSLYLFDKHFSSDYLAIKLPNYLKMTSFLAKSGAKFFFFYKSP